MIRYPLLALAGLLDVIQGLLTALPGWIAGIGPAADWDTPAARAGGLAVILGGIEGPSIHQRRLARGLRDGGWPGAIVVHAWNAGIPVLRCFRNLMSREHQDRQAAALVSMIHAHAAAYPGTRICLLAQSGGCMIAVRALEMLGDDETSASKRNSTLVHAVMLLACAMSPTYDLGRAAAACGGGLYSIRAPGDWVLLGVGTLLLGTSDRRHAAGAGWVGFRSHPAGFTEIDWRPEWIRHGYLGNHITSCSRRFNARVIAPLLCAPRRTEQDSETDHAGAESGDSRAMR